MDIKTNLQNKSLYFLYDDEYNFIVALDVSSWDSFEKSIHSQTKGKYKKGKKFAQELADFLANNMRREFYDLIVFAFWWTIKSGFVQIARIYESRIFPHIAHKISLQYGFRWLIAFDPMIKPDDRFALYTEWIKKERPLTQHDRVERLVTLHGLLDNSFEMSNRVKEKVYVMYMDFVKNEDNRDIEKVFGEIIEADINHIKKSIEGKGKESDLKWLLNNWLMRRYAVKEVLGGCLFWFIVLFSLSCFGFMFCFAYALPNNSPSNYHLFIIFSFFSIPIFLFFWIKGGWRLSKIIWGTAVGWFLIFSAVLADLMYQKFANEQPQLLNLQQPAFVVALLLFGGIFCLIIFWEIKEAEIKPKPKRWARLLSIGVVSIFFGLLEGAILVALVSWYLPEIGCWFNRWAALVLTLGTVQAVTLGVITQLIWESRRLTEIVRK